MLVTVSSIPFWHLGLKYNFLTVLSLQSLAVTKWFCEDAMRVHSRPGCIPLNALSCYPNQTPVRPTLTVSHWHLFLCWHVNKFKSSFMPGRAGCHCWWRSSADLRVRRCEPQPALAGLHERELAVFKTSHDGPDSDGTIIGTSSSWYRMAQSEWNDIRLSRNRHHV